MRSNSVAHVGHDTFICATRDCTDNLFLLTSTFDADNRVAALPLRRRLRVVPDSSLPHTPPHNVGSDDEDTAPVTVRDVREEVYPDDDTYTRSTAAPVVRAHSVRSTSRETTALVPYAGAAMSGLRHSLHTSINGRYVAAISTGNDHHYLLDLMYQPAAVTEFATDTVVRSACWHVARPTLLFLLLVSDELVVYDVTQVRLYVSLRHVCHVPLRPLLRRHTLSSHSTATSRSDNSEAKAGQSVGTRVAAMPAERPRLDIQKDDVDDEDDTEAADTQKVKSPSPAAAAATPVPHTTVMSRWATTDAPYVNEFGQRMSPPHRTSDTHSNKKKISNEEEVAAKLLRDIALVRRTGASVTRPVKATASLAVAAATPTRPSTKIATRKETTKDTAHKDGDNDTSAASLYTTAYEQRKGSGKSGAGTNTTELLPLTAVREERRPTSALRLVDLTMVMPTRSMPPVLLLLSSSGDVFSMALDGNTGLPECCGNTNIKDKQDGRLRLPHAQSNEPYSSQYENDNNILHHILPSSALTTTVDEEALAVRCALLDEDTGLHAVIVCFSSGVLRGAWASEPELLARGRINNNKKSNQETRRGLGVEEEKVKDDDEAVPAPYNFRVDLGRAVNSRGFVSRALGVPTTTHTVQMSLRRNICLVRYDDDAAYLVALPVWDVVRKGWSYWSPEKAAAASESERVALPLVSTAPSVPALLALRIPFDVTGAGLALGCRELVIVPEIAATRLDSTGRNDTLRLTYNGKTSGDVASGTNEACVREYSVSVQITSLLNSALYARCGDLRRVYTSDSDTHRQINNNNNSNKMKNSSKKDEKEVEAMAMLPSSNQARHVHHDHTSNAFEHEVNRRNNDGKEDMSLDTTLNCVAECHRLFLCGYDAEEVDRHTAELAARVEATVAMMRQREQALERRQSALQSRVSQLLRRVRATSADVECGQRVVLDRIVHRRGMPALGKATATLAHVAAQLDALEKKYLHSETEVK